MKRFAERKLEGNVAPALFGLLVGCLLLAYLGSANDLLPLTLAAGCAAALAAAAICAEVLRVDARLAAEETAAAAAWPVGETVHSLARSGRSALLVMVRLDRRGRVLEAAAFDPDEYS